MRGHKFIPPSPYPLPSREKELWLLSLLDTWHLILVLPQGVRLVSNPRQGRHHGGRSSKELLDAERVLRAIGLKKGDTFLDAGCGDGYFSLAAAELVGAEGKVYAVDIYEPSVENLKKQINARGLKNIEAIAADITRRTPLASESIDICLMANVLHGFVENNETDGVMKEVNRALKTGAILGIVEFKKMENIPGPPFPVKLAPEQVAAIITPYNYCRKQVGEVGKYHYAMTFVKE